MTKKDKLERYREKRDFGRTGEPRGGRSHRGAPRFVIQKHDASSLHYDLRLEIGGVLVSWAVPKGLSTGAGDKRLAIRTEDHPLGYADFEGVIPEGEYGAGTVMVWDAGTFRNLLAEKEEDSQDLEEALAAGLLEVWLEGEKLRGGYALKRTDGGDEARWLAIKLDDEGADARRRPTSTEPDSVKTGRSLEQIAADERRDGD